MKEKFSFDGVWYIPDNPDDKLTGTLYFDPQEGLKLELIGAFNQHVINKINFEPEIILGSTTNGKKITLYKCSSKNYAENYPGIATSILRAHYVFVGAFFNSSDELVFNKASTLIKNLDGWLSISGFEIAHNPDEKSTTINYKLPAQIGFKLDDDFDGMFNFISSVPFPSSYTHRASIEQKVRFIIDSKKGDLPFTKILDAISRFQVFLTLAAYEKSYPLSIVLYSTTKSKISGGKESPQKIELFYSIDIETENKEDSLSQVLFYYRDIKENFENIIQVWYKQREVLNPILALFLGNFYDRNVFSENKFLNAVQAVETFHRRYKNNAVRKPEEHKKMMKEIIASTPGIHKEWLKKRLEFSNEPTLYQRLEELLGEYWNTILAKIITDKDKFLRDVKNSRNYYTHYDKNLEKKKLQWYELSDLTDKLKVLLICCILSVMSFDKAQIEKLVSRKGFHSF